MEEDGWKEGGSCPGSSGGRVNLPLPLAWREVRCSANDEISEEEVSVNMLLCIAQLHLPLGSGHLLAEELSAILALNSYNTASCARPFRGIDLLLHGSILPLAWELQQPHPLIFLACPSSEVREVA